MVTYHRPTIDFSTFPDSDGEPMAENHTNRVQMTDLIAELEQLLPPPVPAHVDGNQFIYYNQHDGRQHISPDVYVALGVPRRLREKWETWKEHDKFPDIVFEITSDSTVQEDLGPKRDLYARLGAQEYFIYDPMHGLQPPLRGFQRVGQTLEPITPLPGGALWSPALGAELRIVGRWLRLIDPRKGTPFPVPDEERDARLAAETELAEKESVVAETNEQLRAETQARLVAEDQTRRAQAELEAAWAELARYRAGSTDTA